jgi:eukaryotic-like serine/threonine-protein kinase
MSGVTKRPADSAGPAVTLSVVEGLARGKQYRFTERTTAIVGRAEDCDPRIDEPGAKQNVSRHHCLFDINPPDIRVRDFGSLNGTYVNDEEIGRRLPGQTPEEGARLEFRERDLADGDRIILGNTVLQVSISVPAPAAAGESRAPRACSLCGDPIGADSQDGTEDPVCQQCQADRAGAIERLIRRLLKGEPEAAPPEIRGYELVKKLGEGGQGAVYLARHQSSGELVALKMLLAQVAVREGARAEFQREIDNIQALHHPHVVAFREAGTVGAAWFFTSEYCAGGSVDALIDSHKVLAPDTAVPLVLQALEGLQYAHTTALPNGSVGLVHRDIKPANILLARHERDLVAKLADFGLAKAFDKAGLSGMSMTGDVGGTVAFMARPQVISYKYAKPDVDVWSMAASLYYLLTGRVPRDFPRGQDPIRVVLNTDAVPIRDRDRKIPKRLAKVIDEALVDKPRITIASAADLAAALREAL